MPSGTRLLRLGLLLLVVSCHGSSSPKRANVVLITLDTTRADYLSCFGGHAATPSLDELSAQGTRFDLAVSTAAVTPVSHASILTGLFNHEHGLRVIYAEGGYRPVKGVHTLATVLAEQGYH